MEGEVGAEVFKILGVGQLIGWQDFLNHKLSMKVVLDRVKIGQTY